MPHIHAPLTLTSGLRMSPRHLERGIPELHVAGEFWGTRPTVATLVARYPAESEAGLGWPIVP